MQPFNNWNQNANRNQTEIRKGFDNFKTDIELGGHVKTTGGRDSSGNDNHILFLFKFYISEKLQERCG